MSALVLPAVVFVFLISCSDADGGGGSRASESTVTSSSPESSSSPEKTIAGEEGLLYLDGRTLRRLSLDRDFEEALGRVPSADVTASVGGDALAYIVPSAPSAQDEDFVALPDLYVRDVGGGGESLIGSGVGPLWHPDGRRLAYLEPRGPRVCEAETCEGTAAVVIADVEEEQRNTVLGQGRWALLAWLGDALVVADRDTASTVVVDMTGSVEQLGLSPDEFWGASPDGRWVAAVEGDVLRFLPAPGAAQAPQAVDISGRILAEGAWAPTSDVIAAVVLDERGGSSLALIEPAGGLDEVEGSRGAAGPVLWASDGSSYVYVRSSGRRGLRLEAVHCELGPRPKCARLLSWARGISPLALSVGG